MVTSKPNVEFATTTSRVISRRLRRAGFLMSDTSDRFSHTEGFRVGVLGCSNIVSIDYHAPWFRRSDRGTPEERERRAAAVAKCREWLADNGYALEEKSGGSIYVACRFN